MSIFKEIKRRARNVALAAMGRGAGWQEKLEPVQIKISPMRVSTFRAEQIIGPIIDEFARPEVVMESYRRGLAEEIGRKLLDEGVIAEEISPHLHELGLRGPVMRMTVKVVIPEEKEAKP